MGELIPVRPVMNGTNERFQDWEALRGAPCLWLLACRLDLL